MNGMASVDLSPLAELVRERRERADLTQEALAAASGVSRDTIAKVERGKIKIPSPGILKAFARCLPVTVAEMTAAIGYTEPDGSWRGADFLKETNQASEDMERVLQWIQTRVRRLGPEGDGLA